MKRCGEVAIPFDVTSDASKTANRARGSALVRVGPRDGDTVLRDLHQSGSAKVLFPRTSSQSMQAVWLNTAGGITGGDRFDFHAVAEPGASLSLTTQAAERIYRASPGAPGEVVNHLEISGDARIDWLPQETILFDAASIDRRLRVNMSTGSRLLACESLIFGRTAMGEDVHTLSLRDRIDLYVDGTLTFADRLRIDGDASAALDRTGVANAGRAVASVLLAAPDAICERDALRKILPDSAGVSAPSRDIVFLRLVAADSYELRRHLVPVLRHLTGTDLPRPWML